MLQLDNTTPFAVSLAVMPDEDGIDSVYPIVKASFTLGSPLALAGTQISVTPIDEYWGDATTTSIKYPAEIAPLKVATDVLFTGSAHAPLGRPVQELSCGLTVAGRGRMITVYGDRQWKDGFFKIGLSDPAAFVTMPVQYERAFGGTDRTADGSPLPSPYNPVGRGYHPKKGITPLNGTPAHNLEDPRRPVNLPTDLVPPAGFGPLCGHWEPRIKLAGTYDEAWQKTRAPYLPKDYNPRFQNRACDGLIFTPYLTGGENFELIHLSPAGNVKGQLPRMTVAVTAHVEGAETLVPMVMETVHFRPDEEVFTILWKGKIRLDKKVLKLDKLHFALAQIAAPVKGL